MPTAAVVTTVSFVLTTAAAAVATANAAVVPKKLTITAAVLNSWLFNDHLHLSLADTCAILFYMFNSLSTACSCRYQYLTTLHNSWTCWAPI
jgi:hypothetical protein